MKKLPFVLVSVLLASACSKSSDASEWNFHTAAHDAPEASLLVRPDKSALITLGGGKPLALTLHAPDQPVGPSFELTMTGQKSSTVLSFARQGNEYLCSNCPFEGLPVRWVRAEK